MADNAAAVEDDLSLPRAAVNKMIKEMIPMIRVSNDARELVLNCCTEFIHLIASEANEICNKQTKKTISPEHVIQALESLGFHDYVKDVEGVYQQFKKQAQTRKKNNKMKNQGVSEEELLRQQQALIAKARAEQAQEEWMHMQQHNLSAAQQQHMVALQQQMGVATQQPITAAQAQLGMMQPHMVAGQQQQQQQHQQPLQQPLQQSLQQQSLQQQSLPQQPLPQQSLPHQSLPQQPLSHQSLPQQPLLLQQPQPPQQLLLQQQPQPQPPPHHQQQQQQQASGTQPIIGVKQSTLMPMQLSSPKALTISSPLAGKACSPLTANAAFTVPIATGSLPLGPNSLINSVALTSVVDRSNVSDGAASPLHNNMSNTASPEQINKADDNSKPSSMEVIQTSAEVTHISMDITPSSTEVKENMPIHLDNT